MKRSTHFSPTRVRVPPTAPRDASTRHRNGLVHCGETKIVTEINAAFSFLNASSQPLSHFPIPIPFLVCAVCCAATPENFLKLQLTKDSTKPSSRRGLQSFTHDLDLLRVDTNSITAYWHSENSVSVCKKDYLLGDKYSFSTYSRDRNVLR